MFLNIMGWDKQCTFIDRTHQEIIWKKKKLQNSKKTVDEENIFKIFSHLKSTIRIILIRKNYWQEDYLHASITHNNW